MGEMIGGILIEPPLIVAIESNQQKIFQSLLEAGADVNAAITVNRVKETLQHMQFSAGLSARMFSTSTMGILNQHDKARRNRGSHCPLLSALQYDRLEMAETLYKHKNIDKALAARLVYQWQHDYRDYTRFERRSERVQKITDELLIYYKEHNLQEEEPSNDDKHEGGLLNLFDFNT